MRKIDVIDMILKVLIVLAAILVVYWFIQIMFGGSPTIEQFVIGAIIALITLIIHLYYNAGRFNQFIEGTFPRFENNVELSFNKIKEDMALIKNKLKI